MKMDEETRDQLDQLGYPVDGPSSRRKRPLLICDVDEVILHLVEPFIHVIEELGYELKSRSFKLTGNVFHRDTGREATQAEVWQGLDLLFQQQDRRQLLVGGAGEALAELSRDLDIVFLTNMPHAYRELRKVHLANHALAHPLITNTGSKVAAVRVLQSHHDAPVGFIDDTPRNLEQVRDEVEGVHLFHFMANEDFRSLAGEITGTSVSTGDWGAASSAIRKTLVETDAKA